MAFNPADSLKKFIRNSPWVFIAVMVHVIALSVLAVWQLATEEVKQEELPQTVTVSKPKETPPEEVQLPPEVLDRKAIPKNEEAEVVTFEEDQFIPTDTSQPEDLTLDRGDPNSVDNLTAGSPGGTAIGVGSTGHHGTRPSAFGGRKLGGGKFGRGGGATQGTEKAVLEGLRWLLRHQNPDGSWGINTLKNCCDADKPCYDPKEAYTDHYNEGLTAMALLCFLGAGYSHESKQDIVDTVRGKRHKVGEVVKNGLKWLMERQNEAGYFSKDRAFMYNEALGALALTEAYGLTNNGYWKKPAQKAIDFLVKSQRPNPAGAGLWGWRYDSRMAIEEKYPGGSMDEAGKKELFDSDISVSGWVVMALKSAKLSGLNVEQTSLDGAMNFCKWVTVNDGLVGYNDPKNAGLTVQGRGDDKFDYHPTAMSALGMCTRIFVQHDPNDPFLEQASARIIKDLPVIDKDRRKIDYYYWYYASLALNQFDGPDSPRKSGKYWGPWNKAMVDCVVGLQDATEKSCNRGGWMTMDRWAYTGGAVYTTAINVLTLEVYYRYENAFGGSKRN